MGKRTVSKPCKYSNDCFTCPLPECKVDARSCYRINMMPLDKEFDYGRRKEKFKIEKDR